MHRVLRAVAVVAIGGTLLSCPTVAADAADPTAALQMNTADSVLVDAAHSHVFVSGDGFVATDLAGGNAQQLSTAQTMGIALSADADTLYVAAPNEHEILAFDATDLSQPPTSFVVDTQRCPQELAIASSGDVWFSYGCAGNSDIGVLDPSTGTVTLALGSAAVQPAGFSLGSIHLANSPAAPDKLFVINSGFYNRLLRLTINGAALTLDQAVSTATYPYAVAAKPDGTAVVYADDGGHWHERSANDLATVLRDVGDNDQSEPFPQAYAVAYGPGGWLAAGLWTYRAGSTWAARKYETESSLADSAWNGTTLYLLTDDGSSNVELSVHTDATFPQSWFWVTSGGKALPGDPVAITGTLLSEGLPIAGATVSATRFSQADSSLVDVPPTTTAEDGSFTLIDHPPTTTPVRYAYTLSFAGDATHDTGTGYAEVLVAKATTGLTIDAPKSVKRAAPLTVSGVLKSDGSAFAGVQLSVQRIDMDGTHALPPVSSAANGSYAVHDHPPVGGQVRYQISYAGDSQHKPVAAHRTVSVIRAAPTLTIRLDRDHYTAGQRAHVVVHLGRTYRLRTVAIYAGPAFGDYHLIRSARVDANGNLAATLRVWTRTLFKVQFAGDERYSPARATVSTGAVHAVIRTRIGGWYGRDGSYYLFHRRDGGAIAAAVLPPNPNLYVTFVYQVHYQGRWTTVDSATVHPNRYGKTKAVGFSGPTKYDFRIRGVVGPASINSTVMTTGAVAKWWYLRFR